MVISACSGFITGTVRECHKIYGDEDGVSREITDVWWCVVDVAIVRPWYVREIYRIQHGLSTRNIMVSLLMVNVRPGATTRRTAKDHGSRSGVS